MNRMFPHSASLLAALMFSATVPAQEPETQVAMQRSPRFFFAASPKETPIRVDVKRTPVLSRRISVKLRDVTLEEALDNITRQAGLKLSYSKALVPIDKKVRIVAQDITVAGAISEVLFDVDVDVLFTSSGQAVLLPKGAVGIPVVAVGTITGRVTESMSGEPVPRVQVTIAGTALRRTTDDSGHYVIPGVPAGQHLVTARRVGYAPSTKSANVPDDASVTLDFTLERVAASLASIVTTATGQQERYKVGNAIGSITPDSVMTAAPVTNITDLLSGRVPGLQVYVPGGMTGVSGSIRIRGTNSYTVSNDPIVIVDGVRVEGSAGAPLTGIQGSRPGRLNDISPFEIETIEVVKGPSATTLYGSDAANGVIVITTKRGTAGGPRWRFWTEQGTFTPAEHFGPLYYAYGRNVATGGLIRCNLSLVASGTCTQDSIVTWNPLEDEATTPLSTGDRRLYGAQVSGGVQSFTYFLSAESNAETGYLRMPDAEQERIRQLRGVTSLPGYQIRPNYANITSFRTNVGTSLGSKGHVRISNGLAFNESAIPGTNVYSDGANGSGSPPTVNGGWAFTRPGERFSIKNVENTSRHTSSISGDYQPSSLLAMRATAGLDQSNVVFEALARNGEGPPFFAPGARQDNRSNIGVWSVDASATLSTALRPSLTSRTTVGAQYNRRREYNVFASGTGLVPGASTLAGAAVTSSSENTVETIVAGMFVEQGLELSGRVFVSGAVRFDGGSAFGSSFTTKAYPKASISWLASDGGDGRVPRWVDLLRLRGAVGSSGVQPSAVAARQRDCLASTFVNGVSVSGASLCQLGNINLKPETQTEIETGLDAELLRSRVNVELTLYHRQSKDAISTVSLAPSAGGLSQPLNLGSVRNRGIEAAVNARALDRRNVTLDLGISGNFNENRLLNLGRGVPVTPTSQHQPGHPLFSLFAFKYTYGDSDGNGIITANEVQVAAQPSWMGTYRPQQSVTGTVGIGLLRETLRLSAMADYRSQFVIPNNLEINNCIAGVCRQVNDPTSPLDRQAAAVARSVVSGATSGFIYDGNFLRLREVSASYALGTSFARKLRARGANISLSARNVGLFLSDYPGFSVEAPQQLQTGDGLNVGNPGPPTPRYLLLRLTLDY